jgi:NhaP-type Na+/H+ or K+/H+ antiporter
MHEILIFIAPFVFIFTIILGIILLTTHLIVEILETRKKDIKKKIMDEKTKYIQYI